MNPEETRLRRAIDAAKAELRARQEQERVRLEAKALFKAQSLAEMVPIIEQFVAWAVRNKVPYDAAPYGWIIGSYRDYKYPAPASWRLAVNKKGKYFEFPPDSPHKPHTYGPPEVDHYHPSLSKHIARHVANSGKEWDWAAPES